MKPRSLILCLACILLLAACGKGDAADAQPNQEVSVTESTFVQVPVPETTPREQQLVVIAAPTGAAEQTPAMTIQPASEPTPAPTPEPTDTPEPTEPPAPMLGVLDGRFADKFVTGKPVLTNTSYQSDKVAIYISRIVDESKTITDHTFVYYLADVYFQSMEDFRSGPALSWQQKWKNEMLVDVAKSHNAIFAVSGDFTLTREKGLVTRNGELLRSEHDPKFDVGVVYRDGHMETYTAQKAPVAQLTSDPEVWHIMGFGPELLDENGQPKTDFNDPKKVSRANIRNAVGYYEPGHFCFVYVQPYKVRKDATCLDMASLSKLMQSLGCVRAFNLDGGGTAGMYFNGKLVSDKNLGPTRKIHDIYYIPRA